MTVINAGAEGRAGARTRASVGAAIVWGMRLFVLLELERLSDPAGGQD